MIKLKEILKKPKLSEMKVNKSKVNKAYNGVINHMRKEIKKLNDDEMYETLTTDHPIDLCRLQVANCYMGKIGLINSGGGSKGKSDLVEAITTAVINKRAGGSGLIMGRKAFQKPLREGVELLQTVQGVYLDNKITIA